MNRYESLKLAGLCRRCGNVPLPHKTRCKRCHEQHLAHSRDFRNQAIKKGLCRYCCKLPRVETKSMCEICLPKHKEKERRRYQEIRAKCIVAYGGKCRCIYCHQTNEKYLQLDHINNDGAAHRRQIALDRGGSMYMWAFRNNFPNNLQLLCANCHQAKTIANGCTFQDHQHDIF